MDKKEYLSLIFDTLNLIKQSADEEKSLTVLGVTASSLKVNKSNFPISDKKQNKTLPIHIEAPQEKTIKPIEGTKKDNSIKPTKKPFTLSKPKEVFSPSNKNVLTLIKKIDPSLYIHPTILDDSKAKKIKNAWKERQHTPKIPILYSDKKDYLFLKNLAKAIDLTFMKSHLIEATPQKKWDLFLDNKNIKLIIAPDYIIHKNKELMKFYKEDESKKNFFLKNSALILLPDINMYLKDSYLKRSLWNAIRNKIDTL